MGHEVFEFDNYRCIYDFELIPQRKKQNEEWDRINAEYWKKQKEQEKREAREIEKKCAISFLKSCSIEEKREILNKIL